MIKKIRRVRFNLFYFYCAYKRNKNRWHSLRGELVAFSEGGIGGILGGGNRWHSQRGEPVAFSEGKIIYWVRLCIEKKLFKDSK